MRTNPLITLTTDFGLDDPFVGVMKGVILTVAPRAQIVDLSHGIPPHDLKEAALTIGTNYRFFPAHTVHVVVVDPGVGSERRPILVIAGRHYFIGPDNGVFSFVYEREIASLRVIHITASRFFLREESPTFQGRDVFAPVAARVARGMHFMNFGAPISDFVKSELPKPKLGRNALRGEVIHIDRFGNCMTNIRRSEIDSLARLHPAATFRPFFRRKEVPLKKFYAQAKDEALCAVINSSDYLELFVNRANAAELFRISIGDIVEMKRNA
jgi:S-adenosylmethionine hydrolase